MLHISENEVDKEAQAILTLVKNGENGIAVCYPTCKISYNLLRFLDDKILLKKYLGLLYRRFAFCIIPLSSQDTEETFLEKFRMQLKANNIPTPPHTTFSQLCEESLNKGKEPYLFILDTHEVNQSVLQNILQAVHEHILLSSRVKSIIFFENNIYRPGIYAVLSHYTSFLQNIIWVTPLQSEEAKHFIHKVAGEFHLSLSDELTHQLIENLGGYIWILKAALRYIRDTKDTDIESIINAPLVKMRIQMLFDMFSQDEKHALSQLVYADNHHIPAETKDYFLQIGIVKETERGFSLTIPALLPLVEKTHIVSTLEIDEEGNVSFEKRDLKGLLTEYELKTLQALLKSKGKLLPREALAQSLWGDNWEDRYSDWALDKLISRLRKSLQQIGLPSTIITTRKRQGFLIA